MKSSIVCIIVSLLGVLNNGHAQVDPHFSQYYAYPMWLNPALTGTLDANYRVAAIYRNQWSNITNAFSTAGVSTDFQTGKNINFGINVLQQSAGNGGYRYFNAQVSVAYTGMKFGDDGNHRLSFALQPGVVGRSFDESKFKGGDQWVPIIGYNPNVPTSDILIQKSSAVFDIGAGVSYYNTSEASKVNVFGGFSASHLTQPSDPFLVRGVKSRLPIRYTAHAGARIVLSEVVSLVPNALYMKQGTATETMLGGYFQLSAGQTTDVMVGAKYRFNDAISPFVGLLASEQFMIGLSYDVNNSQLGKMVKGSNAFEISITLLGSKDNSYYACPKF